MTLVEKFLKLQEMGQSPVINIEDLNNYETERLQQYKDHHYVGKLNKQNQSYEEFEKDIEGEIELAKIKNGKFNIIRVFNDNDEETIGYITYYKESTDLILNVTIFRTAENFIKKKGGVSVIDELENFIKNSFKQGIETIHWTCYENNPIKEIYNKRFLKYKPYIKSEYDKNHNEFIVTYILNKINLPTK